MNPTDGVRNSSYSKSFEDFKDKLVFGGYITAGVVVAIAGPIIGPLGSLGSLFSAAYHGICLNYHWRHTAEKDDDGNLISGTELNQISWKNLEKKDRDGLEHESKRLDHEEKLESSLKFARGFAKCTIPVIGLIWAFYTETNTGGSVPIVCKCCKDQYFHEQRESLNNYIKRLR